MNQVTSRYKMKLFSTYEGNRPSGLGGYSEQTDKQTDKQTDRQTEELPVLIR